jgi:acyl-CoA dehydrogenase
MDMTSDRIILVTAERLFADLFPREALLEATRGHWPSSQWDAIEAAGFPLALVDEQRGGFGVEISEALGLVRMAAKCAVPLPLAETMLANCLLGSSGIEPLAGAFVVGASGRQEPLLVNQTATGCEVTGSLSLVAWPNHIAGVVAIASSPGGTVHLVRIHAHQFTVDNDRRSISNHPIGSVSVSATLSASDCVELPPHLDAGAILRMGAAIRAVGMAGAMQRILEITVSYAQVRSQFGRPLSKFQVIQHEIAKIAAQTTAAAACADMVSEAFGGNIPLPLVAAAKSRTGEAAGIVAALTHQLHGAIGVTQEYGLNHLTNQLWQWRDEFGSETYWNEQLCRHALRDGDGLWPFITSLGT